MRWDDKVVKMEDPKKILEEKEEEEGAEEKKGKILCEEGIRARARSGE